MVEQVKATQEVPDTDVLEAVTADVEPVGEEQTDVASEKASDLDNSMFTPDRYLDSLVRVQSSDAKATKTLRAKYKGLDVRSSESAEGRDWRIVAAGVELTISERDGVYAYKMLDGEGGAFLGSDITTEAELQEMWKEFRRSVDQHKADTAMKRARRLARRKLGI